MPFGRHGSAMTVELMVRKRVADAVKYGWHVSQPNEMPMKVPWEVCLRRMGVMQPTKYAPAASGCSATTPGSSGLPSTARRRKCTSMLVCDSDLSALQVWNAWAQTWTLAPCASLGSDSICKASWQHSCRVSRWEALLWLASYLSLSLPKNFLPEVPLIRLPLLIILFPCADCVVWVVNGEVSLQPRKRRALVASTYLQMQCSVQ